MEANKNNPIILDKDEKDIIENLNSDDIEFLQNMPLYQIQKTTIL